MNEVTLPAQEQANIAQAETWAQGLVIAHPQDYDAALTILKNLKALRAGIVQTFAKIKADAHAAWKGIVALESGYTNQVDAAERIAKGKLMAYQQAEEEKRVKEERRLQAEADEKARKEREKLAVQMTKASAAGKLEKAEALSDRMDQVEAPVVRVESRVTSQGASLSKTWQGEVVDMMALIRAASERGSVAASFLMVDECAVRKFAIATKGAVQIAGIKFSEKVGMSVRSK